MAKTFKGTHAAQQLTEPTMQFITPPEQEPAELLTHRAVAPEGYKLNPLYIEKKSKRVQLVMQPSLYDKAKAKADELGVSFNEYIHIVLEDALETKQEV